MTRLFNLESYVDCCHYAGLFHQSPEQLIPQPGDLPTAYKTLLQKYINHPYLPEVNTGVYPQYLTINPGLDYLLIGTELEPGDKQRLFIIRDTVDLMTLSTSDILNHQDGYLYSSAYHYWNHYTEIYQRNLTKPLVFIDLDSFTTSHLIPINIYPNANSNYRVPILNTKKQLNIDFSYNAVETYNNICKQIAHCILNEHFPAAQSYDITHLTNYLQKISLFQLIQQYIERDSFELIIEILYHSQVFYKRVTLSIAKIAEIVSVEINARHLNQIAKNHPEYQFILVTQYNVFPQIQQLLPDFICLNSSQEFNQIWQAKTQLKFPLFGIYLDNIEFAVGMLDEKGKPSKQWIQLSNQENAISYEGKPTVLIGRIPSKNQEFFRISPQKIAKLPIRVNGDDYCKNGIPQDYSIKIENPQGTEDVCIR